MALRELTILAPEGQNKKIKDIVKNFDVVEMWESGKPKGQPKEINIIIVTDYLQDLTDALQKALYKEKGWRLIVSPVETTIPRQEDKKEESDQNENAQKIYGGLTREALYEQILKGTTINSDFILLVFLSVAVTIIGLVTDNLAVIIGAMVIAPLLGPNLALSFGISLGDQKMIAQALKTNVVGVGITIILSVLFGSFLSNGYLSDSHEYIQRTSVGYDGIILALASGSAAVLSLTAGISSTMVGVMVAVALMPPAVAFGLALGGGIFSDAYGAFLLLAINVICVNIAAIGVFAHKGIKPRSWYMQSKSKQSKKMSLMILVALLTFLVSLIYLWQEF